MERVVLSYQRTRDPVLFERILTGMRGLMFWTVKRFALLTPDLDDLKQAAQIGVYKAALAFDPGRDVKFSTYARSLMEGEIRHFLRDCTSVLALPRSISEKVTTFNRPLVVSIDELLGQQEDKHDDRGGMHRAMLLGRILGVESHESTIVIRTVLYDRVRRLPRIMREILYLYHFCDLSQTEVGAVLGVTQKTISRLYPRALAELRSNLGAA